MVKCIAAATHPCLCRHHCSKVIGRYAQRTIMENSIKHALIFPILRHYLQEQPSRPIVTFTPLGSKEPTACCAGRSERDTKWPGSNMFSIAVVNKKKCAALQQMNCQFFRAERTAGFFSQSLSRRLKKPSSRRRPESRQGQLFWEPLPVRSKHPFAAPPSLGRLSRDLTRVELRVSASRGHQA